MDETMRAAYKARHKQAFRIAFDTLEEVFPPEDTAEYFEPTLNHLRDVYNAHMDNPLCKILMTAIANYLGEVVKERKEQET